jgi:mycothiol synthase
MNQAEIRRTAELTWVAQVGGLNVGQLAAHPGSGPQAWFVRLAVDLAYRRQGIGHRLLAAAQDVLRHSGCVVLEGIAVTGTDGEDFARHLGAVTGDELADNVLTLAAADVWQLRRLATLPPGYAAAHWTGSAPGDLIDSYALAKRSITDAPNQYPPAVPAWTADLVRADERARSGRGATLWVEVAVLAGTRTVAALTEAETTGTYADASQHDTVVLPAHRRRGLATAVKASLLIRLRTGRPDLVSVGVTCAVANHGMRSVNHRLGFREERRRTLYRLRLP